MQYFAIDDRIGTADNAPAGAVVLSEAEYLGALNAKLSGQETVVLDGALVIRDRAPSPGHTWAGGEWVAPPEPEPEPPEPVTRIERRQGLRALLGDGVTPGITRAMLEGMIAAIENPVEREIAQAEFEHTHWTIDSPFIMLGAANFGLTEEQVQALFEQAGTL